MANSDKKLLIFIPTYNEKENIKPLIEAINKEGIQNLKILFIDDNSPDGTGKILDNLSKKYSNLFVIHRKGKLGIGSAHFKAIHWAYKKGYQKLITMDCDFTHNPKYIKRMLYYSDKFDLVTTSRYLRKDSLNSWSTSRKILTYLGHFLTKILLGMPYDASGAFRLYDLNKISEKVFGLVKSSSYSFFFESLYFINLNNYHIKEISIVLLSRSRGQSKMKLSDIKTNMLFLFKFFIQTLTNKKRYLIKQIVI